MKKIFVTGATGFLGSHLLQRLIQEGDNKVFALYRTESGKNQLLKECPDLKGKINWIQGDLFSENLNFADIDVLYHLAGYVGYKESQREQMERVNVEGTRAIVDRVKEQKPELRFIHLSSVVAIGASFSHEVLLNEESEFNLSSYNLGYFETKKKAEEIVRSNLNNTISINPSTIYGKRDFNKSSRKAQLLAAQGKLKFYPEGGVSIVSVSDVCDILIKAILQGGSGQRYVVSGDNITIKELLSEISRQAGSKAPRWKLPKILLLSLGRLGNLLQFFSLDVGLSLERMRVVTLYHWFSNKKATKEFQQDFKGYQEAIKESLDWAKERGIL